MLFEISNQLLFILFLTGLVAGTIDAIAGGSGLICLPMLLGVGVPPHIALGTNKLQTSIGTLIATWSYHHRGLFSFKIVSPGLLMGFIGAIIGAVLAQYFDADLLKKLIPLLLLLILIYILFAPRIGDYDHPPRMNESLFYCLFGFLLGFYDGFFGPATGSFWTFLLIFFLGYNFTKATGYTKILNLNSNLIATACFALGHNIDYRIGACMAVGQLIGARIGALLAIQHGPELIRPIFIIMVSFTILMMVYKSAHSTEDALLKLTFAFILLGGLIGLYIWRMKCK